MNRYLSYLAAIFTGLVIIVVMAHFGLLGYMPPKVQAASGPEQYFKIEEIEAGNVYAVTQRKTAYGIYTDEVFVAGLKELATKYHIKDVRAVSRREFEATPTGTLIVFVERLR